MSMESGNAVIAEPWSVDSTSIVSSSRSVTPDVLVAKEITDTPEAAEVEKILLLNDLEEAVEESKHQNWDGEGALAVSKDSYQLAQELIKKLPSNVRLPLVAVESNGKVLLEWISETDAFSVLAGNENNLIFAGSFDDGDSFHHKTKFFNDVPFQVLRILKKYFSRED